MKPKPFTGHDGFVTESDINDIKDEINRGKFQELVCDLIVKEPDLGTAVSLRYQKFVTMLQGVGMSIQQRAMIDKHVCLSIWVPIIALARAHRRAWDDVLPKDSNDEDETPHGGTMSDQPVPNPFECARRVVGVTVLLKPEDIMSVWSITRRQAEQLIDRHASSIAVQMFAAGQSAAVQIIQQEGVPE